MLRNEGKLFRKQSVDEIIKQNKYCQATNINKNNNNNNDNIDKINNKKMAFVSSSNANFKCSVLC